MNNINPDDEAAFSDRLEDELDQALKDVNDTVDQATKETASASEPYVYTPAQEAIAIKHNEMLVMLGKYDLCRANVEKVSGEIKNLRIALDKFDSSQMIQTTVAGIMIPMTAGMVMEAKRQELARSMNAMKDLMDATSDRAAAMADVTYLADAPVELKRLAFTKSPDPVEETREHVENHGHQVDEPIPAFLTRARQADEDEGRGVISKIAGRFARNSG